MLRLPFQCKKKKKERGPLPCKGGLKENVAMGRGRTYQAPLGGERRGHFHDEKKKCRLLGGGDVVKRVWTSATKERGAVPVN